MNELDSLARFGACIVGLAVACALMAIAVGLLRKK